MEVLKLPGACNTQINPHNCPTVWKREFMCRTQLSLYTFGVERQQKLGNKPFKWQRYLRHYLKFPQLFNCINRDGHVELEIYKSKRLAVIWCTKTHLILYQCPWYQMIILTFTILHAGNRLKGLAYTSPEPSNICTMKVLWNCKESILWFCKEFFFFSVR